MSVPHVLRQIVDRRRERFGVTSARPPDVPVTREAARAPSLASNRFLSTLRAPAARRRAVIAEVKMGSPRIGSLVGRVDPAAQARLYADGGAAALSVVVEPDHFHGSWELLTACIEASGLPAIAKDFVVHPRQLELARAAGADAILLIAALYPAAELAAWAAQARSHGLVPLVETHDAEDLDKLAAAAVAAAVPWEIVGINNRDLRTFEVDVERSARLVGRLPANAVRVAESGISSGAEVDRLAAAGFDAFLVGESLLLADDPAAKLAELVAPSSRAAGAAARAPRSAEGDG